MPETSEKAREKVQPKKVVRQVALHFRERSFSRAFCAKETNGIKQSD